MPDERMVMILSAMAAPILMLATWLFAHAALAAWPRRRRSGLYSTGAVASLALSAALWIATYARI